MARKAINHMEEMLGNLKEMSDYFSDVLGSSKNPNSKSQKAHMARRRVEDLQMAKEFAGYCQEVFD